MFDLMFMCAVNVKAVFGHGLLPGLSVFDRLAAVRFGSA